MSERQENETFTLSDPVLVIATEIGRPGPIVASKAPLLHVVAGAVTVQVTGVSPLFARSVTVRWPPVGAADVRTLRPEATVVACAESCDTFCSTSSVVVAPRGPAKPLVIDGASTKPTSV